MKSIEVKSHTNNYKKKIRIKTKIISLPGKKKMPTKRSKL